MFFLLVAGKTLSFSYSSAWLYLLGQHSPSRECILEEVAFFQGHCKRMCGLFTGKPKGVPVPWATTVIHDSPEKYMEKHDLEFMN